MRPLHLLVRLPDAGLKLSGVALATASAIFGISMGVAPPVTPRIHGMEHLSVFARPGGRSWDVKSPREAAVDFKPTGSIRKSTQRISSGYEILSITQESALLRLPEGRVARVARGSRIAGLGAVVAIERRDLSWVIVTEGGFIR